MKSRLWAICGVVLLCFGLVRSSDYFSGDGENFLDTRDEERTEKEEDTEWNLYRARNTWNDLTHVINQLSNPDEDTDTECEEEIANCVETGGKCVQKKNDNGEMEDLCKCPEGFKFINAEGCKNPAENCDTVKPKCKETGGSCKFDSNNKIECTCPTGAIYAQGEGCQVSAEVCKDMIPDCPQTGGSCKSTENGITCECGNDVEYKQKKGCQVPASKCSSDKPKCEETGGSCIFNSDKNVVCSCSDGTTHKQGDGCQVTADKCAAVKPNCKETGGHCEIDSSKNIECLCPPGTEYKEKGCEVMAQFCKTEKPNCTETGGSCKSKENEGIVCECWDEIVYEQKEGCQVPDQKCKEIPKCKETGGLCKFNSQKVPECSCPKGTKYDAGEGCQVNADFCTSEKPNCTETGGSCKSKENDGIVCECWENIQYEQKKGCQVPDEKCKEIKNCKETGGLCKFNSQKVPECSCPTGTKYDQEEGCQVNADFCVSLKPKCTETGGSCKSKENDGIICECWEDIKYEQNKGCLVPDQKCKEIPKCKETGGLCKFNSQKVPECSCPTGTIYDQEEGCQVNADVCISEKPKCTETGGSCISKESDGIICECWEDIKYEQNKGCVVPDEKCEEITNCKETGGLCKFNSEKGVECSCPEGTKYDQEEGCQVNADFCVSSKPKCTETGGSCKSKEKDGIICECWEDIIYEQNKGCVVPTEKCDDDKPKCKDTGGFCKFNSDKEVECSCPNRTTYEGEGCQVDADFCKSNWPNCTETGGSCKSKENEGIICECWEGIKYEQNKGCLDFCEEVCGDGTDVECKGDRTKKDKITCQCKEKEKSFDKKDKECKIDYCKEKCGKIKCSGDIFDESEVKCVCPNEFDDFDEEKKNCKRNYCREVCGNDERIKCEDPYKRKALKDCKCDDDNYVFKNRKCLKKCSAEDACENGGECDKSNLCKCKPGTSGERCEIVIACEKNGIYENCKESDGECSFNKTIKKAECKCPEGKSLYDKRKGCEVKCDKDGKCEGSKKCNSDKFCLCDPGYEGEDCETIIGCKTRESKCNEIKATCIFDKNAPDMATCNCTGGYVYDRENNKCHHPFCFSNPCKEGECVDGYCKCPDNKFYDYAKEKCEEPDKCLLRKTPCAENEVCVKGECKCIKEDKDKKCESIEFCSSSPCFTDGKCDNNNGGLCYCEKGKYYKNRSCKKFSELCNLEEYKTNCTCPSGTTREDGNCVPRKNEGELCDTDCGYGICVKKKDKTSCKCFTFATLRNDKCLLKQDNCAGGKLEKGGMKCKCEGQYTQADDGITCKLKTCEDEDAKKDCASRGAVCTMDWKKDGYYCKCPDGYDIGENGKCTDLCSTEKHYGKCPGDSICYNKNEKTTDCKCPPTFEMVNGKCTAKAQNVYLIKNIPVLKKQYETKSGINKVLLNRDLINSVTLTFSKDVYDYGYLFDYKIKGDVVICSVWINFKKDPKIELDKIKHAGKQFSKACKECDDNTVIWPPNLLLYKTGLKNTEQKEVNFCSEEVKNQLCGKGSKCENNKCTCKEGFKVIELSVKDIDNVKIQRCEDIDECATGDHICSGNTTCVNTLGSYKCACKSGYQKNPIKGKPVDPETDKSDCYDMCTPSPCIKGTCSINEETKSFDCHCEPGAGGTFCHRKDVNYASAKKSTVVVGAVLGSLLAVGVLAALYYIIKVKKRSGSEDFSPAPRMDRAEMTERRPMRGVVNKSYE